MLIFLRHLAIEIHLTNVVVSLSLYIALIRGLVIITPTHRINLFDKATQARIATTILI